MKLLKIIPSPAMPTFLIRKTDEPLLAVGSFNIPDNKCCVNHKNGVKKDNRVENLEWCTHSENTKHSFEVGLQKGRRGKNNTQSKPVMQFSLSGKLIAIWESMGEVEPILGFEPNRIGMCCKGRVESASKHKWKFL